MPIIFLLTIISSYAPLHLTNRQLKQTIHDQLDVKAYNHIKQIYSDYDRLPHDARCEMKDAAAQIASELRTVIKFNHLHSLPEEQETPRGDVLIGPQQVKIIAVAARHWENEALRYRNGCNTNP